MRRSAKYHLEPIFNLPARGLATTASHSRRSLSESWQPLLSPALIICLSFPALLSPLLSITPSFIASSPLLPVRIARFPRHHGSFGGLPRPSSSPSPLPPSGKWVYLATVGRLSAGACPGVCVYACACTCVTHLCICTSGGNICWFMRACPCFSLLFFFIFCGCLSSRVRTRAHHHDRANVYTPPHLCTQATVGERASEGRWRASRT